MKGGIGVCLLLAAGAAFGGDAEFNRVVKAIESRYATQRTHVPLMGVANLFVKVKHPSGVGSFKMAIFENLRSPGQDEWRDLDRFMGSLASGKLRPLVRCHSRHGQESTYILAGPEGRSTRMLIATFERHEATVIQVKVDTKMILRAIADPERAAEAAGGKHGED